MALLTARGLLLVASLTLLSPLSPAGEAENQLEYQVKAAFLFNFLKFVEWPPAAPDSPWVIGVLGRDPFGGALDSTVRGKTVNGRKVDVRRYTKASDVKDCNILFIGRDDYERTGIPTQPGLLTVGESSGFLKAGGAVSFYVEDDRVRFEIRPASARSAGLHVSSQLLKVGRVF